MTKTRSGGSPPVVTMSAAQVLDLMWEYWWQKTCERRPMPPDVLAAGGKVRRAWMSEEMRRRARERDDAMASWKAAGRPPVWRRP